MPDICWPMWRYDTRGVLMTTRDKLLVGAAVIFIGSVIAVSALRLGPLAGAEVLIRAWEDSRTAHAKMLADERQRVLQASAGKLIAIGKCNEAVNYALKLGEFNLADQVREQVGKVQCVDSITNASGTVGGLKPTAEDFLGPPPTYWRSPADDGWPGTPVCADGKLATKEAPGIDDSFGKLGRPVVEARKPVWVCVGDKPAGRWTKAPRTVATADGAGHR
jgi:hypothetical protein